MVLNIIIATLLLIIDIIIGLLLILNIEDLNVDSIYFVSMFIVVILAILHFFIVFIYYILKIKNKSIWHSLGFMYMMALIFIELLIPLSLLTGFMGDM